MIEFWSKLLDTSDFPARWTCGNWSLGHGLLHIFSDIGIWSAYFAIPGMLLVIALRRERLPFRRVFLLFVAFILLCGMTHLMEAIIFGWPAYRLAGVIKLTTAVVSWVTVFALWQIAPQALQLRTPEELEREVVARREAEAALQRANAELEERVRLRTLDYERTRGEMRQLANAIPQLAWMARPDGHIDWYNQRWFDYTGRTPDEMEGWGWQDVHDPDILPGVLQRWKQCLASGEAFDMVFPIRGAHGAYRPFLTRIMPFRDDDGEIVRWFGTNTDIGEQLATQEDLRRTAARLSEANQRKNEFIALLAHELRNPLAPIRTGLDVLKLADDDVQQRIAIRETMERQVEQLTTLVDDLLDVSRLTLGKLQLKRSRTPIAEIVDRAIEAARPLLDEFGHELVVDVPAEPLVVEVDPHRMTQVLSNLLNNAAKYTPHGGHVRIAVTREGDAVLVAVQDDGLGIPPEARETIFDMFSQLERPGDRSSSGLGMGLTLVKSLVELHGGRVEIESAGQNQGSTFRVRLPVVEADAEPRATLEATTSSTSLRILVVDDNREAADMLAMLVGMLGNEVRAAHDGRDAVRVAREFQPELVLMDIGMPVMDGYEAARTIRAEPWGRDITLVALTGWGQDEDRERTRDAGFDQHLVKPVELGQLETLLADRQRPRPDAP